MNPNAFPEFARVENPNGMNAETHPVSGMSFRQYVAAHVMSGFASYAERFHDARAIALLSVQFADALIEELEKP